MVSLSKILMIVAVVFAIWYVLRWLKRLPHRSESKPVHPRAEAGASAPVEDLIACSRCGDYAPVGAAPCQRADCPRR